MDKFETSGKQVEQYMSEQAHELMLKQELRKLREEDMKKQSERAKRLEFIQKVKVIQSEKESQSRIKIFRERDQALIQLRYESAIRSQLETEEVQRTLAKWAHSGFNTSRTKLHTQAASSPTAGAAVKDPLAQTLMSKGGKGGDVSFANKSITDFQVQLLMTASKKAAEKKKAGEDAQGQK